MFISIKELKLSITSQFKFFMNFKPFDGHGLNIKSINNSFRCSENFSFEVNLKIQSKLFTKLLLATKNLFISKDGIVSKRNYENALLITHLLTNQIK